MPTYDTSSKASGPSPVGDAEANTAPYLAAAGERPGPPARSSRVGVDDGEPPPSAKPASSGPFGETRDSAPVSDAYAETGDAAAPVEEADEYVGRVLDGRYIVERVLGRGGMGVVYLGRHRVIDKRVALKVLHGDLARDPEIVERFLQEAKAASSIGNLHIVDISDFGTTPDGSTYFVMEYLPGRSLSALIDRDALDVGRIVGIAKQIASGLAAAHAAGIVHRDLKPDNVMLVTRGRVADFVKILDFGIAKVAGGGTKITRAGTVFGTPHYMSPEQSLGAPVDGRADIYALGVMLYEMLTRRVPFDAENYMGILNQHVHVAAIAPRARAPERDVPRALDAIVMRCLEKRPERRYPSMDALLLDLERFERGELEDDAAIAALAFDGPVSTDGRAATTGVIAKPGITVAESQTQPHREEHRERQSVAADAGAEKSDRKRRMLLLSAVAGVTVLLLAAAGARVFGGGRSSPVDVGADEFTGGAAATRPEVVPGKSEPTAAPAPAVERLIVVATDPADAVVVRDGEDLGRAPVALRLRDGEAVTIVVSREGYRTETVVLDGGEDRKVVRLTKAPAARPPPPKGKGERRKGSTFGPEIENPWGD
jgi:serine/threonine-protein kinase